MNQDVKKIIYSFIPGAIFVVLMWIVKLYEIQSGNFLTQWGVLPRELSGLTGIITSPFVHGNFEHLISNSIPMLVVSAGLIYFYKSLAFRVFLLVYLLGGFWLWLGGRESYHIGASGIVYGLTSFLFFSGVLRRDTRLMAISLLVVFLYGGMIWGVFPLFREISWEAHLFGALAGLLVAIVYRKEGPQRKVYEWEKYSYEDEEEDEDDDENAYWKIPEPDPKQEHGKPLKIRYIYRSRKSNDDGENQNRSDEQN